ncbi:hypothetical protein [Paraflavitalea speifideaquila]|uniref:hypothetical protein n=1 Tax=Paraflavitalea speifideaquila TaxID=3076558 RepID=UPI0028E4914F|nr:hypothetical protein [Paraflavitalea speifideiaquila]
MTKTRTLRLFLAFFLFASPLFAQKIKKADKAAIASLQAHISYLSDDKLEGRRAGTNGEKLAGEYISSQFQQAGLQPKGDDNTWFQAFEINDGKQIASTTFFFINNHELKVNEEFFPSPAAPMAAWRKPFPLPCQKRAFPGSMT